MSLQKDSIPEEEREAWGHFLEHMGETLRAIDPKCLELPLEQAIKRYQACIGKQGGTVALPAALMKYAQEEDASQGSQECFAVAKAKRTRFVQLSLVPEFVPAANAAIRSRLFTTGTGPRFKFEDFTPIATWHKNLQVSYEGEELRQEECSLWIQLCKIAANDPEFKISCTRYQLLKHLKKSDTGDNRRILKKQLLRLFRGKLHIKFGEVEYFGSILPEFAIDGGKVVANLSKTISKLLGIHDFTMLSMEVRLALPPMAQWFHAFLKSQEGPEVSIPWKQIHELSGSKESNMENYKRNFRKAVLKPLKAVGFVLGAKSKSGNLVVEIDKRKG